jgi:release factor glutamine methyltransferase
MQAESANVAKLIRDGESYLVSHGVPNARRNAEWLLAHVLDCRSADLYMDTRYVPATPQIEAYGRLLKRRGSREPLQYILGTTEFMSLPFCSSPGVFIPRPDTEILVEKIENCLAGIGAYDTAQVAADRSVPHQPPNGTGCRVADLCCGSGVIAVSIAKRLPGSWTVAVDVSPAATDLTTKNAELNGVGDRIECVCAEAVEFLAGSTEPFDAVVCNPPYVPTADIASLPPEIRYHEPRLSLDGGVEGLDFYCAIISVLRRSLKSGGVVGFEIGTGQAKSVCELLDTASLVDIRVYQDYVGNGRVVITQNV